MKISIDTKEDSPEDIRKLVRMLLALLGDSSNYAEKSPPASGEGLFDMFGDPQASTAEQQQLGSSGSGGDSSSQGSMDINDFLGKAGEQSQQKPGSDEDEDVRVVPY
ncbi:hypothetical protein HYU17_04415 [Candidatus Woesearchaeota archaeon]|nr:hypothetical protein [Candidatus Woesearchaeota archaeon]